MRKRIATILGFLIAPLFAAIALIIIGAAKSGDHDLLDTSAIFWVAIFYWYTLGATLVIGLPAYLLLKYFNKVTWWSAILGGLLSGAVMMLVFNNALNPLVIVIGGLSGLVFWLIWRQGH